MLITQLRADRLHGHKILLLFPLLTSCAAVTLLQLFHYTSGLERPLTAGLYHFLRMQTHVRGRREPERSFSIIFISSTRLASFVLPLDFLASPIMVMLLCFQLLHCRHSFDILHAFVFPFFFI